MLTYQHRNTFREAYCEAAKTALTDNHVLLFLTYYDTPQQVKLYLENAGINFEKYSKMDSLFVIDSAKQLSNSSVEDSARFINLLHKKAKRQGRKGLAVILDMAVFFHLESNEEMAERFEVMAGPEDNQDSFTWLLCAYHKDNFDRLDRPAQKLIHEQHAESIALP
jgi:hypothetical protein